MIEIIIVLVIYGAFMTVMAIHNRNEMQKWVDIADKLDKELKIRKGNFTTTIEVQKGMGIVVD